MRRKGARKKSSLNAAKGSMFSESTTETKKGKLTGGSGRYFSKKIDEVEDDDKVNLNDAVDGSDVSNSDDVERQSNVEVGKDQENGGGDEDTGTDDDAGSKENCVVKHSGHITRSNVDKNESGSGGSNDEGDAGNSNESGSESEEDEGESDSGSEEDEESEENSEAETVPSKQKKLNKQLNVSSLSKKGMKPIQKLPKFQGTTKASEQNQQAGSPSKKRKKCNDDDEVENQISPAKELHANWADSPSKKRKKPYDDDEVENKISPAKKSHGRADSPRKKRKKPYNDDEVENQISPAKKPRGFDVETEYSVVIRKEERNVRSLFLKDLPPNTTVEMVKKLSPEIINVHIPLERNKKVKSVYAFIEFESEEAAERNYRNIKEKTIDNKKITVDYCGKKSNHYRKEQKEFPVNLRRLFIPSVPMDVTADELKQCFPDAKSLTTKQRGSKRLAFMSFENEAIAKKVFEESGKLTLHGKKITVVFAYKKKRRQATMNSRKRAKIVFDDGGLLNVVKAETKDESKKNVSESTETTKEVKKQKRKKKKNPKIKTT